MERDGNRYYAHRDAQKNITEISDATGQLVERYTYDIYGSPRFFDGAGSQLAASAIGNPYLFTARRYDSESGNYNYRARYFNPQIGRFLSQDMLGIWGDEQNRGNGYSYVKNNPVSFVDPFGLLLAAVDGTSSGKNVHYNPQTGRYIAVLNQS
jgi:RHS repeat-associated protein